MMVTLTHPIHSLKATDLIATAVLLILFVKNALTQRI